MPTPAASPVEEAEWVGFVVVCLLCAESVLVLPNSFVLFVEVYQTSTLCLVLLCYVPKTTQWYPPFQCEVLCFAGFVLNARPKS